MNKQSKTFSKLQLISLILLPLLISACGSDGDSKNLAKAVDLESQRQQGTIIESVTIVGGQMRLKATETHQLSATGIDTNNDIRDVTNELTWTSSDDTIAKVSSKGLVTAVANSEVNQGIVIITGTTINDIYSEVEISVSDANATAIELKQSFPETGSILTCIDASIVGDISYEDGYKSLNTVKNMTFALDDASTATITTLGDLYTSSSAVENTTITANIDTISDQLTVTADPSSLEAIDILLANEVTTIFELALGERILFSSQASLLAEVSEDIFNIDNSVSWQQKDSGYVGITNQGDEKGTLLALKPGITEIYAGCGGKKGVATIVISGKADLDKLQINDDEADIVLDKNGSLELTLTATYTDSSSLTTLNVSEFADWSILNGTTLATAELTSIGTDSATYTLSTIKDATGTLIVTSSYDGVTSSVNVTIE
jgi:hypothetical protein